MTVIGASAWCELVTEMLRGQRLLDQVGFSVVQVGFGHDVTRWTHASFLDGRLHNWVSGPARTYDLSVTVDAEQWLAPTGNIERARRGCVFEANGQRDTVLSTELRHRLATLPRLPNAHLDVVFHFTTSPFGSFDVRYRVRDGRVDLALDQLDATRRPDVVISLWFGHLLGAMVGDRIVLEALECGRVRHGAFQHLMLLAGLLETPAHRAVFRDQRHLYVALARHGDILGAPALRAAALAASLEGSTCR